jgi:putative Mg2+ transporter-C (MgtC) family protein
MDDPALSMDFWRQVAIAAACGGSIGLERQLHGKPMGVRTGVLICVATALFVLFGTRLAGSHGDPSRVIGQVVVGIGFLGAGVIFNRGDTVQGLTSASLIWLLGALGSAAGLGLVWTPLLLTTAAVVVVAGLERLARHVPALRRGAHAPEKLDSRDRPQV